MIDKIKNVPLLWLLVQLQSISKLNASGYLLSKKKKKASGYPYLNHCFKEVT